MSVKVRRIDFSPDEWLAGAFSLKAEQRGCYVTVIMLIYSNGGAIRDDEKELAHACNVTIRKWLEVRAVLIAKGKVYLTSNGELSNKRCEIELEKAINRSEKAKENGEKGGKNSAISRQNPKPTLRDNNDLAEADASTSNQANHQPSTTNYNKRASTSDATGEKNFGEFYAAYPRHVGRGQASKAYAAAIRKASPETILAAAQRFAEQSRGSDPKYIAHPATWLNGERWLDEAGLPLQASGQSSQIDDGLSSDERRWRARWRDFQAKGFWLDIWGPKPGEPGCQVPAIARAA